MPKTDSGHTYAGSARWSDTASQASATDQTTTNSQNQIQRTGSPTSNVIRYAAGYDGGPPNGGFPPGIYEDRLSGRRYIVPEPPRADGSTGPPQTSPLVRIYEYNGDASFRGGPEIYLDTGSRSQRVFGLGPNSGSLVPFITKALAPSGSNNDIDQPD